MILTSVPPSTPDPLPYQPASTRPLAARRSVDTSAWEPVLFVAVTALSLALATLAARSAVALPVQGLVVAAMVAIGHPWSEVRPLTLSFSRDIGRLLGRLAAVLATVGAATAVVPGAGTGLLRFALLLVAAMTAGRFVALCATRALRRAGFLSAPAAIIGSGPLAQELWRTIEANPQCGLVPVAMLSDDVADPDGVPVHPIGDLDRLVDRLGIRTLLVSFAAHDDDERLARALRQLSHPRPAVWVVPRLFESAALVSYRHWDSISAIPLVKLARPVWNRGTRMRKRALDIAVSGSVLLVALPAMGIAAAAVKATSRGPVLFRQQRVGQYGDPFDLLKFRSMRVNTDSDRRWSVRDDDRVTRVGALLRRTSIDELPQLINVLRGEMSIVGPRPERPYFVERFGNVVPRYHDRHRLPVGLTGLAQVSDLRGADSSIELRARFDNFYIDHWRLRDDLRIMLRTVPALVRGEVQDLPANQPTPTRAPAPASPSAGGAAEPAPASDQRPAHPTPTAAATH